MSLCIHLNSQCTSAYSDKPNKQVKGNPEATLFVARLSHSTTEGRTAPSPVASFPDHIFTPQRKVVWAQDGVFFSPSSSHALVLHPSHSLVSRPCLGTRLSSTRGWERGKHQRLHYLPHSFSADRLREVFSKYGKVEHCRLVRDIGEPHLKNQHYRC